ncbi:glutathione S-transferase family protein [uncultured Tateyamaria sp.]|uniref:glutathione S-transferase family protein n=1 Tax=uncultured Tateyamaria sp. TaxID=455651 RepID=UPI002626E05A|nr:glutathione S-transferase [uncultured Tateyamaria sp.]
MITIHCLAYSRAIRLIWLMEDLGQPYDLVRYDRTDAFRAPQALRDVHPLGKSPVIEDGDLRLAESASCLRYLTRKFDDHTHTPDPGSAAFAQHEEMLDYVESSFAAACMRVLLPAMKGEEVAEKARDTLQMHLGYIAQSLPDHGLLFGDAATLADIQMSYLLANLAAGGFLAETPRVATYWNDLQKQPGYIAATNVAGPMAPDL